MKVLKYPIIPVTLSFASGIFISNYLRLSITANAAALAVALAVFGFAYYRAKKSLVQKPWFGVTAIGVSLFLGALAFSLHYTPNKSSHFSHLIADNENIVLTGTVSERVKPNDFSEKYYFNVESVNKEPATGKILITIPKDSAAVALSAGDVLVIYDSPRPITGAMNPYQFDYAKYMETQGVFGQVKLKGNYFKAGTNRNFDYYTGKVRETLISSFAPQNFSSQVMNVIKALLLGQRQDIDKSLNENYIDAGVVHILAISGLHIGILFFVFSLLLKPLRRLNKKGLIMELFIMLALLWSFAVLAGLSASIVRAVVMFSFVAFGKYLDRDSSTVNSIAVSMLVLLLARPTFLFDVGFQLSYAAVIAIVWLNPLYSRIKFSKYKLVNYFTDLVIISFIAQLGVLPLSLYYFNQFPLLFPIANIVVIPLATALLIIGLGVLALNFIWLDAALFLGKLLSFLIELMNSFIAKIASYKSFVIKDIPFTILLSITAYLVIILAVRYLFRKNYYRAVAALVAVLIFQGIYTVTKLNADTSSELVIFQNWQNSLIAQKEANTITLYSNDSLVEKSLNVASYVQGNFSDSIAYRSFKNVYWENGTKLLVIDSSAVYSAGIKSDILLLCQSPKINLERVADSLQPKVIVADATNYKSYIERWRTTCSKRKIPFHATAEKGSYSIK